MAKNIELVERILSKYKQISNIELSERGAQFELHGNKYELIMNDDFQFPIIRVIDCQNDYPHIYLDSETVDGKRFRQICLTEPDSEVAYLYSDEEKVSFCVERLLTLTELNRGQIIDEYQKEFSHYWDFACYTPNTPKKYAQNRYQLYLDGGDEYQWLSQTIFYKGIMPSERI